MKKLLVFGLATLLVIAFCVPASALENVFGGYWRVRGYKMKDFSGKSDGDLDTSQTTTRTRLYYTAILNDNLKLVNKFEMDAVFGGQGGDSYGDLGADGVRVEVKNSYADFNTGALNWKLGVQGAAIGRSLVFDNDFAGAQVLYRGMDNNWWLRGTWIKPYEAYTNGSGNTSLNNEDYDAVALETMFKLGDLGELRPYGVYSWSKRFQGAGAINGVSRLPDGNDASIYWLGLDTDLTLGPVSLYGSVAYSGGTIDGQDGAQDTDLKGYVVVVGADVPLGPATLHTKNFYASGDAAEPERGSDVNGYVGLSDSFYWSEIMGFGTFDDVAVSAGSPGDKLTNIWAISLGATIKPFDKLSIRGDLWYAEKPEDDPITDDDKLGVEADLRINYELVEGLNLELVGAYLWADDATSTDDDGNDEDPYEIGFQTSLSF